LLGTAQEVASPFPVAVLTHGLDPQVSPRLAVAAEDEAAGGEHLVPEQLGRLVEQDHVHPPFGSEVGKGHGYRKLEGATRGPAVPGR
jgi:hypothetical protein